MKIVIESTTKIVFLDGVQCRVWEGVTERGVPMHAFIARAGVHESQDASQFEAELRECRKPSPEIEAFPLRMIL